MSGNQTEMNFVWFDKLRAPSTVLIGNHPGKRGYGTLPPGSSFPRRGSRAYFIKLTTTGIPNSQIFSLALLYNFDPCFNACALLFKHTFFHKSKTSPKIPADQYWLVI